MQLQYTPTPAALLREAERLRTIARLAWAQDDERGASKCLRHARQLEQRARAN
jgi:hypothetical protein